MPIAEVVSGAGREEIKPKLVTTFKQNSSEVAKYVAARDKAQLYKDKGKQMISLSAQLRGETPVPKLGKLPDDKKQGGLVGTLVYLHAESALSTGRTRDPRAF